MMKQLGMVFSVVAVLLSLLSGVVWADQIPEAIKSAVSAKDPGALFLGDSKIQLSNGEEYILVEPSEPKAVEKIAISGQVPVSDPISDVILFNDGHFLVRIDTLPNGRKTLPMMSALPDEMRHALFPQNIRLPDNFLIPTIWKSLTGDLLVPRQGQDASRLMMAHDKSIYLWDSAKGRVSQQFDLPCAPHSMAIDYRANRLFAVCQGTPALYQVNLGNKTIETLELEEPAGDILINPDSTKLFMSHPDVGEAIVQEPQANADPNSLPHSMVYNLAHMDFGTADRKERTEAIQRHRSHLSVYDLLGNKWLNHIPIPEPVNQMVMSGFRQQLYCLSKSDSRVYIINTVSLAADKGIVSNVGPISELHIQDEKVLWMVGAESHQISGFDLRWQELADPITVPDAPGAIAHDGKWLYLLMPKKQAIYALDLKNPRTASWIALDPDIAPAHMVMAGDRELVFVTSDQSSGIQIINVKRGEWVGTHAMDFTPSTEPILVGTNQPDQTEQVNIKFQDGRLLIQNARRPQPEVSPTDPHDPEKTHTPPEPPAQKSAP